MTNTSLNFYLNSIWKGQGVKQAGQDLSGLAKSAGGAQDAMKDLGMTIAKGAMVAGVGKLIKDSTILAARVETLGVVTAHMGEQMGMTEENVRSLEQSIVDQGITLQNSRQMIAMMIQSNIDLAEATDLARMAQDTAVIANTNSSEAAKRLIYVLQTGNVRMARTLGLNVSFAKSYQNLAKQIGVNVNALSEEQIMQARVNAVKEAGARVSGVYEKAMGTAGKQLLSLDRYVEEFKVSLGTLFIPALGEAVQALTSFFTTMRTGLDTLDLLMNKEERIAEVYAEHEQNVYATAASYTEYATEMERAKEAAGRWGKNLGYATEEVWKMRHASEPFVEGFKQMREAMGGMGDAADTAAERIRGLTEAQYLEKAAEAILAGDYEAAQYYSDMAYQAEIAEENTRELIEALDELDGKKVTSEIWIQTFGGSELGIIGSQQAAASGPKPKPLKAKGKGGHGGKQHGGRLSGINLVGEVGPELIIGDVVIPADLTRRLIALGLVPGESFQTGGRRGRQPYTPTTTTEPWSDIGGGPGTAGVVAGMYETYGTPTEDTTSTEVVEEAVAGIEEAIGDIPGAVADISSQQLLAVQSQMREQTQQTREQNRLLQELITVCKELATDQGITEALLGGLQTTDLG